MQPAAVLRCGMRPTIHPSIRLSAKRGRTSMTSAKLTRDYRPGERFCKPRTYGLPRRRIGSLPSDKAGEAPLSAAVAANIREVLAVASRVASMPDREAAQRYHDLIDRQLGSALTTTERFELERIEARLEARDRNPLIEQRDREWEARRRQLLESVHTLLTRFQK